MVASSPKYRDPAPELSLVQLAAPARHAIQALAALVRSRGRRATAAAIAGGLGLAPEALSKSLQTLARAGVLSAQRGPGGGYALSRDPAKIALSDLVRLLDAPGRRHGRCLIEERPCGLGGVCALHDVAVDVERRLREALDRMTLASLAQPRRKTP